MSKTVKQILEEAAKDIITPETLQEIEATFNESVKTQVDTAVKAALIQQDAEYAKKLEQLVEAIDTDTSTKTLMLVSKLKTLHEKEIKQIRRGVISEAKKFQSTIIKQVSDFLDLELNKAIPTKMVREAVRNTRSVQFIENLRQALAIDTAIVNESIKSAVLDGKAQLDEATKSKADLAKQLNEANKQLESTKAKLILERKLTTIPSDKRAYVSKVLEGKSSQYITENFDMTLKVCEKEEARNRDILKKEAETKTQAAKTDRVTKVIKESASDNVIDKEVAEYLKYL